MKKLRKVQVTPRALIQRINRKLKLNDLQLRTTRGNNTWQGEYYIVNEDGITATNVDLEELAHKLKLLASHEELSK